MANSRTALKDAKKWLIFGLGKTGLSAARFLQHIGRSITCFDTRETPPYLKTLTNEQPNTLVYCQSWEGLVLADYDAMLMSPGLALDHPLVQAAKKANLPICGDIELFSQYCQKSVVAISGSNGKSTVTALTGAIAKAAGIKAVVGGNFGKPALECLMEDDPDCYILELSSFQLALTENLKPTVACLTNIAPDHLDWHGSFDAYRAAKQKIWQGAKQAVFNREDEGTLPPLSLCEKATSVGVFPPPKEANNKAYWLHEDKAGTFLTYDGEKLLNRDELSLLGTHNAVNLMMSLAIAEAMGWPRQTSLDAVKDFKGLTHRCELVAQSEGVTWVNDSKATNVGAVIAALSGLGPSHQEHIIWIAGGQGKGERYTELRQFAAPYVKKAFLIGESSSQLADALKGSVVTEVVNTLENAVRQAQKTAKKGDLVLLSPACASFDQFAHFEARGDAFKKLVTAILKENDSR